jgi:hypothetical protein
VSQNLLIIVETINNLGDNLSSTYDKIKKAHKNTLLKLNMFRSTFTITVICFSEDYFDIAKVRRPQHFQKKEYNKKILFLKPASNNSVMTQKSPL